MTLDHPKLRATCACVLCQGPKAVGLVVCADCHTRQKVRNDGDYSAAAKRKIEAAEIGLTAGADVRRILLRGTPDGVWLGKPVWRGEFCVAGKWAFVENRHGNKIAYLDQSSAVAGAKVAAKEFLTRGQQL